MFRLLFTLFVSLVCCGGVAAAPARRAPKKETASVLFLGNSYTYVNDLPGVVAAMAKAGKPKLKTQSYTEGGAALIQFWEEPEHAKARELVKQGGFDYVILQDQSVTPCTSPQWTLKFGGKWAQLARYGKSKPVFFLTWAHRTPDGSAFDTAMQDELTAVYRRVAQENDALLAPVGEAWRRWYQRHPSESLHAEDGSHPNGLGTYLAGCVFYAVLTNKSALGLPCRLRTSSRHTLSVPADQAKECRQIADEVVEEERKRSGLQKRPDVFTEKRHEALNDQAQHGS